MKVYRLENGQPHLVGRADISDDEGVIFEVPLFGAASTIIETFMIGAVTHLPPDGSLHVERAVLLTPGQSPELLPGWTPLAS